MNASRRVEMRIATDLIGGCVAWALIFIAGRASERLVFPNAESLRPLSLVEAAMISGLTLVVLMIIDRQAGSRFLIATRLFFVVGVLCLVQWTWLLKVGQWWTENEDRLRIAADHPVLTLFVEAAVPALLGAFTWLVFIGRTSIAKRLVLVVFSVVGCLGAAWLVNPEVVDGTLEAARWVPLASPRHLSGAHTNPLPRHMAYIAVATITGLFFYIASRRRSAGTIHERRDPRVRPAQVARE